MVALGAVILSLACAFLGYCLLHFQHELKRSRNQLTSYGLSPEESRLAAREIAWGTVCLAAISGAKPRP